MWWLTGASNGPVRVRTRSERVLKILLAPDREPDHRSGSSPAPNLGPDHGQVRLGSGSNHGSELNLTIPSVANVVGRNYHVSNDLADLLLNSYSRTVSQLLNIILSGKNNKNKINVAAFARDTWLDSRLKAALPPDCR